MIKAYEYRIYPTPQQEALFNQTLGLCRLYWNIVVFNKNQNHDMQIEGYKPTFQKYKPEALEWIKDSACSIPLAQMWSDIRVAYTNFFKSCKGQRKGKFSNPPRFKSKKNPKDSFRYSCSNCNPKIDKNGLWVTNKIGYLDIRASCRFCEGKWKNITFRRTSTGKWFVKICVEKKDEPKIHNGKAIGIDWNCDDNDFISMSDGTKIKCPRFLRKKEKQLSHYQKELSRKFVKGKEVQSNNYYKTKMKVAKLHEKVSWQRKNWLHKISRDLANKYEYVIVENINLQNMAENLNHGKAVGDQGFGMFREMLTYKTTLIKVSTKNTSKTCFDCGYVNPKVVLGVKQWICPVCGVNHDRDVNAAKNILHKGVTSLGIVGREPSEIKNASGEPRSSMKEESSESSNLHLVNSESARFLAEQ